MTETDTTFDQYAIVELMGHRRLGARVTETQIAGAGFLRLDIPSDPPLTQFVAPSSVYALTPTTPEVIRRLAAGTNPAPVHPYELTAIEPDDDDADVDDQGDVDDEPVGWDAP